MGGRRSEKEMIFSFSPLRSNSRSSPFFFSRYPVRTQYVCAAVVRNAIRHKHCTSEGPYASTAYGVVGTVPVECTYSTGQYGALSL